MDEGCNVFIDNDIWDLILYNLYKNLVDSKLIYKIKFNYDGMLERNKVYLVGYVIINV